MKKIKQLAATAIFCAAGFAGYTAYDKATMTDAERMMIANIEALTTPTEPGGEGSFQVGSKVITTSTETTEPGWEWSASAGAWLFEGKVSSGAPSTTTGSVETVTIKCCRSIGPELQCYYEEC